jgi:predicted porin
MIMKKILLGSTAMVGASVLMAGTALASDPPKLELSGYFKFEAWFADQDADTGANRGYHFENDDVEIHFKAYATADNGLKYGAKIEWDVDGNVIDEAVLDFSGNWGTLFLGDEDGANDLMKVGGFSVLTAGGGWDGGPTAILQNPGSVNLLGPTLGFGSGIADSTGDSDDATKISYFTPSFSGFRLGLSLTPDTGHTMGGNIADTAAGAASQDVENLFGYGVEYKGTFNDISVHVSGRGLYGSPEGETDGDAAGREDINSWGVGGKVEWQGFALAAGYGDLGDSGVNKTAKATGRDAGTWYDVGVSYANGPYTVAGGYFHSEEDRTTTTEDQVDFFSIGGNYNLAPGLDVYAEYNYVEIDDGSGTTTAVDNDASLFMVGTKITF